MKSLHIKKILVPVDFSDNSMNALHTASAVAQRHSAAIELLFVNDHDEEFYPNINLFNVQDVIKALETLTKSVQSDDNVECNFSYLTGSVANCIVQESMNENADLIIIGKNGNAGNREMYAGSYAYEVIKKSSCPVLMVTPGKVWEQFNNILFPVRPVMTMLEKYSVIKEIVNRNGAVLHLLNLRNPDYAEELHIISKLVELLKIKFEEDHINTSISYYFKDNRFADKILKTTKDDKMKVDLLVIATEQNMAANTFYFSDYAQQIIHQSNVPVLIIKPETIIQPKEVELQQLERQLNYQ